MKKSARRPSRRAHRGPSKSTPSPKPAPVAVVPGSLPRDATFPTPPREAAHAHMVCRACGRIADVVLTPEELRGLNELADRRPAGWSVDGITFSLTGACAKCRQGPTV